MSRIFRRGELRSALLQVLFEEGAANGYTIMQRLQNHVGSGWRASPGSIYPALLALEDAGQINGRDEDESRVYSLTAAGRRAVDRDLLDVISRRASDHEPAITLATLLDAFAAEVPKRSEPLDPTAERAIQAILQSAGTRILSIINQGATK